MDEQKMPRRPRRSSTEEQPKNESLVYGKNPVTELLKSGSGVDTVPPWPRRPGPRSSGCTPTSCA